MLIDAHCHLAQLEPDELHQVLKQASLNDVRYLVAIGAGYGEDDNPKTVEIANQHEQIYCTVGIHPHDARLVDDVVMQRLHDLISQNPKVRAVGEIGLDYHYMHSEKDQQRKVLRDFIGLAHRFKKPIVIHDRDCGDECVTILREEKAQDVGGMVHCFTGSKELARHYLDLGFIVSFTGIITFKNAEDLRDVVRFVPLERMTIETDSPFLAPIPFRGKKNQPAYVKHVAEAVAQIKGVDFETVAEQTTQNALSFFGIQPNI